jgi:hypothetical protein
MSWLVVSLHDVAPSTASACRAWATDLDRLGVPLSLLVVPGPFRGRGLPEDAETAVWLHRRVAGGDEVVQHGWRHEGVPGGSRWRQAVGRVVARGSAEFCALDEIDAAERLIRGGQVLERLGLFVTGFTPPGWLASPGTLRALQRLGFRYTTSHLGVHDLADGTTHRAFALSHRPGGAGERLGAELLLRVTRRAAAAGRPVRIALHPADREHPDLVAATLAAVSDALSLGLTPTTYGGVVARLSASNVEAV